MDAPVFVRRQGSARGGGLGIGIDAGKALRNWKGVFGGQNKQLSERLVLLSLSS